ncbi:MAG: hypothetical protein O3A85_02470 [Proteobacteria bacterium]|nr:hypothetical protein [Pseudomonadota bacterium]
MIASVFLMAARSYYAFSFDEPLQGFTRGAEYETLYSIWKYVFDGTVYVDQTRIPYDGTFYNWLFYAAYGEITGLVLKALGLSDPWLPTITRLITLSALAVGSFITYRSFNDTLEIKDPTFKALSGAFAVFIFFGPLIGFFGISATPDIWPMVFTVAAIWLFIRQYDSAPIKAILWVCVFSYLSWGFKQNFIYIPATVGLYLLIHRQWRDAALLTVIMCSAGLITLAIGGGIYSKMLYFGGTHLYFTFDLLVRNIANFMVKALPILAVGAAGGLYFSATRRVVLEKLTQRPVLVVPFLGGVVTGIETLATSGLQASSENHFFVFSYFLTFAALAIIVWAGRREMVSGAFAGILALGWVGNLAATGSVLLGFKGVVSVRPYHESLVAAKPCLKYLREPFFIANPYLALPWITPSKQPFVMHLNYPFDRAAGIKMEGGGVGGLIDQGYFATLALDKGRNGHFDGSNLKRYRSRPEVCAGLIIYDRD